MVDDLFLLNICTNRASFRSLQNLRLLNVSNSTFMDSNKFCVVVALAKLRNLQVLNVSNTEFSKNSLELVVEDLPLLDTLDISQTKVCIESPDRIFQYVTPPCHAGQ